MWMQIFFWIIYYATKNNNQLVVERKLFSWLAFLGFMVTVTRTISTASKGHTLSSSAFMYSAHSLQWSHCGGLSKEFKKNNLKTNDR